jgi:cysteine desulfurase family protein
MTSDARRYFDNAATTYPKPPAVYDAMDRYAREQGGTAGRSAHARAIAGSRVLFDLRRALAELFHGHAERVVLTRNATEALNLALFSLVGEDAVVAHGPLEHNSVMRPLAHLAETRRAHRLLIAGDAHGRLSPAALARAFAEHRIEVVVTLHASNVHGLAQDLAAIGEIYRKHEAFFVVDAAQSGGCLPIDVDGMGIDALCLTGHKALFGPTGIGALLLSARVADRIRPLLFGGTGSESMKERMPDFLPDRIEAGTPNTFGAAALLAGVTFIQDTTVARIHAREAELRGRMLERLRALPNAVRYGDAPGLSTATVGLTGPLAPSDVAYLLDHHYGIAVRAGLHCAPRAHQTLGTLPAGTVRLAPGFFTPDDAVDEALAALGEIWRTPR